MAEMNVLVTGGAGFIGSHVAEHHAKRGSDVTVFDNLSRTQLLGRGYKNMMYNWNHLKRYNNMDDIRLDIGNPESYWEAQRLSYTTATQRSRDEQP